MNPRYVPASELPPVAAGLFPNGAVVQTTMECGYEHVWNGPPCRTCQKKFKGQQWSAQHDRWKCHWDYWEKKRKKTVDKMKKAMKEKTVSINTAADSIASTSRSTTASAPQLPLPEQQNGQENASPALSRSNPSTPLGPDAPLGTKRPKNKARKQRQKLRKKLGALTEDGLLPPNATMTDVPGYSATSTRPRSSALNRPSNVLHEGQGWEVTPSSTAATTATPLSMVPTPSIIQSIIASTASFPEMFADVEEVGYVQDAIQSEMEFGSEPSDAAHWVKDELLGARLGKWPKILFPFADDRSYVLGYFVANWFMSEFKARGTV